jgi:hypothetical protein
MFSHILLVVDRVADTARAFVEAALNVTIQERNDPPVAVTIRDLTLTRERPTETGDLARYSRDEEDGEEGLTHALLGNSNRRLFQTAIVAAGRLTVRAAADSWGDGKLWLWATDPDGASVDTSLWIHVRTGEPPKALPPVKVNPVDGRPLIQIDPRLPSQADPGPDGRRIEFEFASDPGREYSWNGPTSSRDHG